MRKTTDNRIQDYITKKQIKENERAAKETITFLELSKKLYSPTTEGYKKLDELTKFFKALLSDVEKARLLFILSALSIGLESNNISTTNELREMIKENRIEALNVSKSSLIIYTLNHYLFIPK